MVWLTISHIFSAILALVRSGRLSERNLDLENLELHFGNRSRNRETLQPVKQKEPPSHLESSLSYNELL